mmetsp:Transcript_11512/g.40179  ORF Transcript_11512/g.40179 Transcript_11512/m.40179 type:complete len:213 (+) Transcript_11512:3580-4218(+)
MAPSNRRASCRSDIERSVPRRCSWRNVQYCKRKYSDPGNTSSASLKSMFARATLCASGSCSTARAMTSMSVSNTRCLVTHSDSVMSPVNAAACAAGVGAALAVDGGDRSARRAALGVDFASAACHAAWRRACSAGTPARMRRASPRSQRYRRRAAIAQATPKIGAAPAPTPVKIRRRSEPASAPVATTTSDAAASQKSPPASAARRSFVALE